MYIVVKWKTDPVMMPKNAGSNPGNCKTLCQHIGKWLFRFRKDKARKKRDGLRLSNAMPKMQSASYQHFFYGHYAMGNLYVLPVFHSDK